MDEKLEKFAEDMKKTLEDFHQSETCKGCRNNPPAKKPYSKMKRLDIDTKLHACMHAETSC